VKLDTEGDLVHELGGARRRGLIIAAGLLVLLGGGVWLGVRAWRHGKQAALGRAAAAWLRWERCFLGPPLQTGERASGRARLVALALGHTRGEKPVGDAAWPRRCVPLLHEVAVQIGASKPDFQSPLRKLQVDAQRMEEPLARYSSLTNPKLPVDLDVLWDSAILARLPARAPASARSARPGEPPPAPTAVEAELARATMQPLERYLALEDSEINADGSFAAVFERRVGNHQRMVLCAIGAGPAAPGRCRELHENIPTNRSMHVLMNTEPTLLHPWVRVYDAPAGGNGIYDGASGELVWPDSAFHSTLGHGVAVPEGDTGAAGFLALGHVAEAQVDVVRQYGREANDTESHRFRSDPPWVWQFDDHMAWAEPDAASGRMHIFASPLYNVPPLAGAIVDIGELPPPRDHLPHRWCRSGDDLAIVHRPRSAGDLVDPVSVLTFAHAGVWAPIVTLPLTPPDQWYSLDCDGGKATLSWNGPGELFQLRCSAAGCDPVDAVATEGLPDDTWLGALGGQALAVWNQDGQTWFRLGPLHELDAVPDRLLIDDADHGGLAGDVDAVYIRAGQALLLVEDHAENGTYAVRIDSAGKVSAVPVTVTTGTPE